MPIESGVIAVIPARWGSTRFPGKPLANIRGKPMIQWVVESVKKASSISDVIVATDDQRIYDAVRNFGGRAEMTSKKLFSGSDRVAEVASREKCDIVVNVQGDEPLIPPENLDLVVQSLNSDPALQVSTLKIKIRLLKDIMDPNIVKVVTDSSGRALYFSRSPIPYDRDGRNGGDQPEHEAVVTAAAFKHIGVYAYRRRFLLEFTQWEMSALERVEKLEQLRILERGEIIKVEDTSLDSPGVDVPEDIIKVERALNEMEMG